MTRHLPTLFNIFANRNLIDYIFFLSTDITGGTCWPEELWDCQSLLCWYFNVLKMQMLFHYCIFTFLWRKKRFKLSVGVFGGGTMTLIPSVMTRQQISSRTEVAVVWNSNRTILHRTTNGLRFAGFSPLPRLPQLSQKTAK